MTLHKSAALVFVMSLVGLNCASAVDATEPGSRAEVGISQSAGVPALVHFQGRLGDATGTPLPDGEELLTFNLYDRSSGATPLWSERKRVELVGGSFETILGDTEELHLSLFDRGDLWLGVTVGDAAELAPRYRLTSAPFALRSADTDSLGGVPATGYAAARHDHDDIYVNVDGDRMQAERARSPVLEVSNTGSGYGLSGHSAVNIGVFGGSGAGSGLVGISGATGVYGSGETTGVVGSGRQTGVLGQATTDAGGATGVRGRGTIGVWGESTAGTGVHGEGGQYGLYGESESGMGVFGVSENGYGMHARSASSVALLASSTVTGVVGIGGMSGAGVYGEARGGVGVSGSGDAGIVGSGMIGVHGVGLTGVQGRGDQQGVLGTSEVLGASGVLGRDAVGSGVRGEGHTGVLGIGTGAAGVSGSGSPGVHGQSDIGEGIVGESSSASGVKGSGPIGLKGVSSSDSGYGVYAENSGGIASYSVGNVAQTLSSHGLVKAAVYAWCDSASARIERSFTQVYNGDSKPGPIVAIQGKQTGDCSINFGFDVSARYVQATAVSTSMGREATGVTVRNTGATTDVLGFYRWGADGSGRAGYIFVLVY